MRISPISVVRKCLRTVEPKLPVPPVMTKVFPLKASVISIVLFPLFPALYVVSSFGAGSVVILSLIPSLVCHPYTQDRPRNQLSAKSHMH